MTTGQKLLKALRYLYNIVKFSYNHLYVYMIFKVLNVSFTKFKTCGIPIVNVGSKNGGNLIIGNNFKMNNGLSANNIGFNTPCVLSAKGGTITIGNNVGISQTTIIAENANITIGSNTLLGGGVKIYTSDFHSLDYLKRRKVKDDLNNMVCKSITIGQDCFIGAGTTILKGVSIGDRSIIGTGSIVCKSIPSDCIAAGNPCRIIRYLN